MANHKVKNESHNTISRVTEVDHVPIQFCGAESDSTSKVVCDNMKEAEEFFATVRDRLSDVNSWGKMSSLPLSSFQLFNSSGCSCERGVAEGDFIRIEIPGPGIKIGKGYDWVSVELVMEEKIKNGRIFTLRVRPSTHPMELEGKIAHFLKPCATSTFQVRQINHFVIAEEHARNEVANIHTGNFLDNLRNAFIGVAAQVGFSYPQWKSLMNGLISK